MKIAIDIDDVVFEFAERYMEFLESKGVCRVPYEDIYTYRFCDVLGVSMDFVLETLDEYYSSDYFEDTIFVDGAKDGVCFLKDNFDVCFITARVKEISKKTRESIFKEFSILGDKVIFSGNRFREGPSKCEICKDLGIDIIVEDSDVESLKYAKNGLRVLLLDKPWNRKLEHDNIVRCKNWGEVLEKVEVLRHG